MLVIRLNESTLRGSLLCVAIGALSLALGAAELLWRQLLGE